MLTGLTPKETVEKLDEFIIGQSEAKKSVAIALRNRLRRKSLLNDPIQEEIHPKNIIMMGPTGVGKTEIARRLARLVDAPFIKVEATKYTEVGYVGRDVESMIRDLLNVAIKMVKHNHEEKVKEKAAARAEERILEILLNGADKPSETSHVAHTKEDEDILEMFRRKLHMGSLEEKEIEIKSTASSQPMMQIMAIPGMEDMENQMQSVLGDLMPKKKSSKKMTVKDARKILVEEEMEHLIDMEKIKSEAIESVEQNGIVFIDEIDKISSRGSKGSPDVSREGVQRDILPIIEGSTVNTRYGSIRTDHILFIAAGAFHMTSVSDLIPELQGRFPIRVELNSLTEDDYFSILHNPKNALTKQYQALLSTEDIALKFEKSGLHEIAKIASIMNSRSENIGARRLHTVMEKLLEDVSFNADKYVSMEVVIDDEYVKKQLDGVMKNEDLSRHIL
ncbi:MAG: ATP-dependent protease ATPase subunit HslU [Spirochaetia bacterium]|nr:ATP-dependent protease ATPase subunit HslU [Spirochaetia bacterium]